MTTLAERCQRTKLLLSDVDGVMTDGGIGHTAHGDEYKTFHVRDGLAIRLWMKQGGLFGIVTGRSSPVVNNRANELDVSIVHQGVMSKIRVVQDLAEQLSLTLDQIAFVGDDLPDLGPIRAVGLGVAVANATEEVRTAAHHVTSAPGGGGALREVVELLLKSSGRWDRVVESYL